MRPPPEGSDGQQDQDPARDWDGVIYCPLSLSSFYILARLGLRPRVPAAHRGYPAAAGQGRHIASAFGGGSGQAAFGARAGATVLTKATAGLAAAFILLSLTLSVWGQRGGSSVVGGMAAPAAATPAPAAPRPASDDAGARRRTARHARRRRRTRRRNGVANIVRSASAARRARLSSDQPYLCSGILTTPSSRARRAPTKAQSIRGVGGCVDRACVGQSLPISSVRRLGNTRSRR